MHRGLHLADALLDRNELRLLRAIGLRQQCVLDGEAGGTGGLQLLHRAADIQRIAVAVIGIDQHWQRGSARHPPHLLGEFGQRDQGSVGIAEHRERSHRSPEHADLETEILGNTD